MSLSPARVSPERTPFGTQETECPAANANTRETITWLMHVQYHGGMASPESGETLRALAFSLPADADALDPDLASVVASIRSFAETAIYDPRLAEKAGSAIERLTAKLSSPVKVISPSKMAAAAPAVFTEKLKSARRLFSDE